MMTHDNVRRPAIVVTALLFAALVASCGGADACVQIKCSSGASMEIPLASMPASGTVVTVCRNTECYPATLPDLPVAEEASAALSFTGATFVVGILWQDTAHSVGLDLEWRADSPDAVVDGDRYVVTLTDPSGTATTVLSQTATYVSVAPSPDQCSSEATCRIAQLSP